MECLDCDWTDTAQRWESLGEHQAAIHAAMSRHRVNLTWTSSIRIEPKA